METEKLNPIQILCNKWNDYLAADDDQIKSSCFDDAVIWLLGSYLSASKAVRQNIIGFRDAKEVANVVAQEFISSTYKQCSDCDDDGQKFGSFLMEGQGMALLLVLELYSEQVTNCCPEMCNLLFSLLPLAFERNDDSSIATKNLCQFKLCDVMISSKPFQAFREALKLYLMGNFAAEGEPKDTANTVMEPVNFSDVSIVCNMIKEETFKKNDLLICLLSSLLGIISSDIIRNDHSLQYDIACKTITLLTSADKDIRPNDAQQFTLILMLPLVLIVEVMPTKRDDIVVDSSVSDDLLTFASNLISILTSTKTEKIRETATYQIRDVLIGCYAFLYWQIVAHRSSMKEVVTAYRKFVSSEIFKVTDRYLRNLLRSHESLLSENSDGIHDLPQRCIGDIFVVLGKIAKKLRKMQRKHTCFLTPDTSVGTSTKRRPQGGARRAAIKRDQKSSSDSDKESEENQNERNVVSEGSDSTGDMSDYVLGASDSDDAKPVKIRHKRNASNASVRSKEDDCCYFGQMITLFTSIYLECNENRLAKLLLEVIGEIGSCTCIDNDQLLSDILKRLETQPKDVADKALDIAARILEQYSPELANKSTKGRHKTKTIAKRRDQSAVKHEAIDGGTLSLDVTDAPRESYHFLQRYKCLTESQNVSKLELLEKHLIKIVPTASGPMQTEIFKKLVLAIFAHHIPYFNKETSLEPDSTQLIEKCLKFLPKFLIHDELFQVFAQRNGISYLEIFTGNDRLAPLSFAALQQIARRSSHRLTASVDGKSVRIFKDPSMKPKPGMKIATDLTIDAISLKATEALLLCGKKLIPEVYMGPVVVEGFQESIVWNSKRWTNLLKLLPIYNELQMESVHYRERLLKENWPQICFNLLQRSVGLIKGSLDKRIDESGCQAKDLDCCLKLCLPVIRATLPLCLSFCIDEQKEFIKEANTVMTLDNIFCMFTESLMHEKVLLSSYAKEVCNSLVQCAIKPTKSPTTMQYKEMDQLKRPRAETSFDKDDDASDTNMEEEGYDADTESEIESSRPENLSGHGSIVRHTSLHRKHSMDVSHCHSSVVEEIKILFPDVIRFVLHSINQPLPVLIASEDKISLRETLKGFLGEVFCLVHSSWTNCNILSNKGLLKLVIEMIGILVKSKVDDFRGVEMIAGRILVLLSASKITADDFKDLLLLFKEEEPPLELLSNILCQMASVSKATAGATFSLIFPIEPDDKLQHEKAASVQQSHTFLIPKREGSGKSRSILRQRAINTNVQTGSGPKSFGYRCQTPSTEIAPVQLPLEEPFTWPDMGFSIAVWFQIKNNNCLDVLHQLTDFGSHLNNATKSRQNAYPSSLAESSIGDDPMVFHICSFGGPNAVFEIWIGVNPRFIECRWLTTQPTENSGNTSNFDQVILPTSVQFNKWNHLIVTIALPQNLAQPHSATVMTYINGCEQMPMSMKFPSRAVQKDVKLSMMLGHSIKTKKHVTEVESHLEMHIGNVFLFKGKEPLSHPQRKSNIDSREGQRKDESCIGNAEACYLYALGPDAFHLVHECGDRYATRMSSHMDSSLTWDSIHFKEMSFAVNILAENLIASDFPTNFLVDVKSQLPSIQTALQDYVVLKYSPRRPYEFCQYIPQPLPPASFQTPILSLKSKDDSVNETPLEAVTSQAVVSTKLRLFARASLQQAVHDSGGIANLLFVFAKVSENVDCEYPQAMLLAAIFSIMEKSLYLIREMNDLAGYVLLHRTLEASPSILGYHVVKALISSMCDGVVFNEPDQAQGGFLQIAPNSTAIVKNVLVLQTLILDWKIWSDAPLMVQELLWQALHSLVRSDHRWVSFNILQFKRARVVDKLLFALQEREQNQNDTIPPTLSHLYINIIMSILGQPPDMPVLKAVCSFLIASHPTVNTLTLHSQSNFYLTPKPPSIVIRAPRSTLKPLRRRNSKEEQKRSYSFTEGLLTDKDYSKESVVGIFSNLPSPTDNNSASSNGLFPKSEVLFRKEHKEMKRNLFAKIDENKSYNGSENNLKAISNKGSTQQRRGFYAAGTALSGSALDEIDAVRRPKCSTPVSADAGTDTDDAAYKGTPPQVIIPHITASGNNVMKTSDEKLVSSKLSMLKSHRRNLSLDVNVKLSSTLSAKLDSQEYDIISDSELPSSLDQCSDEYLVVDGLIGQTVGSFTPSAPDENNDQDDPLFHVRLGLFEVLQNVLTLLPDNLITRIFGTILKVEHLLVLVNQDNVKLREIAVKNLSLYLQRGGRDCVNNFQRFKGFHLLANQLHQYQTTVELGDHCLNLMTDRLLSIRDKSLKEFSIDCPVAMVAYLSLLEDAVQHPTICHTLVNSFIQVLSSSDTLVLVAFEQFLPEVICNMICMLATSDNGSLISRWKTSVFKDILDLILWIVRKGVQTCEADFFQCFKDLLLAVQMLEAKEREGKGTLSEAVVKSARFVQYFMVSSILKLFKTTRMATSRRTSASAHTLTSNRDEHGSTITRRPSRARAFINKLRSSMHVIAAPSVASPSEIQERYLWAVSEGIILATLFSKPAIICEKMLFGNVLEKLSVVDHDEASNVDGKSEASSHDADFLFCSDLLSYMLNAICVCLELKTEEMHWTILLRSIKDDLIAQTSRLLVYLLSPIRKLEMRFNAISQIMSVPDSKKMLNTLLHGISGLKNRERLLSCIGSCLKYVKDQLTPNQWKSKEEMRLTIKMLKVDIINISEQQLFQELRKIKAQRQKQILTQRKETYKRKTDQASDVAKQVAAQGMEVTQNVVEEQDRQRQKLLQLVRGTVSKKVEIKKLWRKIISHLTQERTLWCDNQGSCCQSWQLDPTEGPSRVRIRLQRCHTEIPSKFFMSSNKKSKFRQHGQVLSYLLTEGFNDDEPTYYTFKTNDTIRFHYHCHRVTPDAKTQGDVLIGETHMYFVGEEILADQNLSQVFSGDKDVISISWQYEEIKEILKRRYALQDNAMEIFLTSGRTFLLAFEDTKCRDEVYEQLISRELPNLVADSMDLDTLTIRWREGLITNFEYLTELNKKAGRSFNDLMQYPVFPFILSDYESEMLDLNDQASFRDLCKPIAVQHESKKEKYMQTYKWLQEDFERKLQENIDEATPPYHYGSHYSNSGTVLHFLVRLPPFTKMFLMYQDNQFDIPDRTFHSLFTSWYLSSFASSSDVKEMIPEFYFLPEFLQNLEGYNFGCRQNGKRVHDVILPPWTPDNDARLFVNIHRQALESHCVSSTLHNWIDLVFGYKQDGSAAKSAVNVFHPATYFGVDVNAARDPLKRRALQTMIETYGQTPRKLFNAPHVQRFSKIAVSPLSDMIPSLPQAVENLMGSVGRERVNSRIDFERHDGIQPISTVAGLSWGRYCGSPSQADPAMQWVESFEFTPAKIYPSNKSSTAFVIDRNCCLVMPDEYCIDEKRTGCFSWKSDDSFLVVKSLLSNKKAYFDAARPDKITCCSFVPGADLLFIGGSSGILTAWPVKFYPDPISLDIIGAKQNLRGHSAAITSIFVCRPFSIVVTGCQDSLVIIWDLNRLSYVRSLPKHKSAVSCLSVSRTSGNIATACDHGANGSFVHLWTINARGIWKTITESRVRCIDFSCAPEGVSVNVVVAGLENGIIRIWSTWTLMCIRDIQPISGSCPVVCLAYSPWDPQHLYSCDSQGNVCLWTRKDLSLKPTFIPVKS